jgi:hypothetical protein
VNKPSKRRAKCPDCGKAYNVREDGRLPNHNKRKSKQRCSGGGTLVGKDRTLLSCPPRILNPKTNSKMYKELRTKR